MCSATISGRWSTDGPDDALNLTVNTQPVMLTAGVAVWRAWHGCRRCRRRRCVAGHSLGEYTALVAAGALAFDDALPLVRFRAAGDAGSGAGRRRRDGRDPRPRCRERRRGLRRGRAGAGRRGGQLQRAGADRDRRAPRSGRAGDRRREGEGREARRAAAGLGAVSQLADEAGGRAARGATRERARSRRPRFRWSTTSTSQVHRDARRDSRGARAPGGEPGALGRDDPGDSRRAASTHVVECGPGRVLAGHGQAHRPKSQRVSRSTTAPTSRRRRPRSAAQAQRREARHDARRHSQGRSRSSRAPRAASAARSRERSRKPARRSSARRRPTRARRRSRVSRAKPATPGTGMRLDVTDGACGRRRAGRRRERGSARSRILVNNAGITRDNLLLRMKDDEWDAVMATNLKPVFRLAKAVLRGMMKARYGRIIQIGSRGRRERQPGPGELRGGQGRRCSASPSRSRRKSAAATSPSTAWRRASSTPT